MVNPKLISEFNEKTDDRFDYIRLSSASLNSKNRKLELNFIYPEEKYNDFLENEITVKNALIEILDLKETQVELFFKRSHFDISHFLSDFRSFMSRFPSLDAVINENTISIEKGNDLIRIKVPMYQTFFDYAMSENVQNDLNDFLFCSYCQKILLEFVPTEESESEFEPISKDRIMQTERVILPENIELYIGELAGDKASYIKDIKAPRIYGVLCGRIRNLKKLDKKKKTGEFYKDSFFKFELDDGTGVMEVLVFPTKRSFSRLESLQEGTETICSGEIKEDTFGGKEKLTFWVRNISLCQLPKDFNALNPIREVPKNYAQVLPTRVAHVEQSNFIVSENYRDTDFFLKHDYVVFDVETTGLSADSDKVIEIGAVKIEGGKPTSEFSTYINPEIPIPTRITELTGITDEDVAAAPTMASVIADFVLFCDNTILVAHNADFDWGFMQKAARDNGFMLTNKRYDTIALAKKYAPESRAFKLETLTKLFGIKNEGAHRAIHDARATVELFFKLADRAKGNPVI